MAVSHLIMDSLVAHGLFSHLVNGVVSEVWAQDESVCRYYTCAAELKKLSLATEVGGALR